MGQEGKACALVCVNCSRLARTEIIKSVRWEFGEAMESAISDLLRHVQAWLSSPSHIHTATVALFHLSSSSHAWGKTGHLNVILKCMFKSFFYTLFVYICIFFVFERCILCPQRLHLFDQICGFNVIYSCDRTAAFSEAIAPVFSVQASLMYTGLCLFFRIPFFHHFLINRMFQRTVFI